MKPGLEDTAPAVPSPAPAPAPGALVDRTATFAPAPAPALAAGTAPPTAPTGLPAGQQLGHFRIERRLGTGGMGEVYLATDLALDRPVALKVLPEALAREPRLRERLIREARAQARVVHPNVGHIYYIGEEAGRLYFAMEYLAGQTLAERVAQGPLPVEDALAAIRAAVLGLREAQRSGFLHRDVKPSNLMFDAHGVLKVLDFGLVASATADEGTPPPDPGAPPAPAAPLTGPITQTSLAGTPLYMAPEQASGDSVDCRADIYALGVTLFHLVSGRPPFVADTLAELRTLHADAARPEVPRRGVRGRRAQLADIQALCARMMAPRPEDRFASYDELQRAIDVVSPSRTRPGGFWARSLAAGLDFMLVGLVVTVGFELAEAIGGGRRDGAAALFLALIAYQTLATARWGQTAGKAVFELEVVDTRTLERPTLAVALRRAVSLLCLPTLGFAVREALLVSGRRAEAEIAEAAAVISIAICCGFLLFASLRRAGKRAFWDRLSATLVRYRTPRSPGAL